MPLPRVDGPEGFRLGALDHSLPLQPVVIASVDVGKYNLPSHPPGQVGGHRDFQHGKGVTAVKLSTLCSRRAARTALAVVLALVVLSGLASTALAQEAAGPPPEPAGEQ